MNPSDNETSAARMKRRLETERDARLRIGITCDFCNQRPVKWRYSISDFVTYRSTKDGSLLGLNNTGGWSACDACYTIIEQSRVSKDLPGVIFELIARVIGFVPAYLFENKRTFREAVQRELAETYAQFFFRLINEQVQAEPWL